MAEPRPSLPPAAAAAYAAVSRQAAAQAQPMPTPAIPPDMPGLAPQKRGFLAGKVRLLPLTILAVALLLGLKVGSLWQGRKEIFVTPAVAQSPTQQAIEQAAGEQRRETQQQPQRPAVAPAAAAPAAPAAPKPPAVASLADKDPTTFTRAEIELLANLAQRREQLEQRSRELDLRESLLAAAEKRIDERIAELKKLEASVKQIVQQNDKQEEENLKGLVKVYENMKPDDAARIFEKLDSTVLLSVVERMKEAKVALIFAKMDAATAQQLTVQLATRKQIPAAMRTDGSRQPAGPSPAGTPNQSAPGQNSANPARPAGAPAPANSRPG